MDEEEKLLRLYDLEIKREYCWVTEHQKRIAFFTGLISALVGGTVAGLLKADAWYYWTVLAMGPIIIVGVAKTARQGSDRVYKRWLETITTLMKIEKDLELADPRNSEPGEQDNWVASEQFITKTHLDSRTGDEFKTSEEWVDYHRTKKTTYQGAANSLFQYATRLGWILFGIVVVVSVSKFVRQESAFLAKLLGGFRDWWGTLAESFAS
jgi:hypothetical protein